jgi:hypothetical protein
MLLLLLYVRDTPEPNARLAYREGSIAPSPTKSADSLHFQPFRERSLQVLYDDRNRLSLRQLTEDVHMVRNAAHKQCWAIGNPSKPQLHKRPHLGSSGSRFLVEKIR